LAQKVLAQFVGMLSPASDRESHHRGLRALRAALVSGVALGCLAGLANPAHAQRQMFYDAGGWYGRPVHAPSVYAPPVNVPSRGARFATEPRREKAEPKKEPGFGDLPKGPLQLVVSIGSQKVTLFSNGALVAQGPVSTGVPGHPTPMGVFSIIEKDRYHHSNIYSGAPMPYMQRITWSGVALHEGVLPGYPASHGCIRMSHDFAQKLWPITKLGVRVIVAQHEVAPVEFEHPKLFTPKLKPAEPQVATKAVTDGMGLERPIVLAQTSNPGGEATAAEPQAARPVTQPPATSAAEVKPVETMTPVVEVGSAETVKQAGDRRAAESTRPADPADEPPKATGTLQPAAVPTPLPPSDLRKSVEAPQRVEPAAAAEIAPATTAQPGPAEAVPAGGDSAKPAPTVDPARAVPPRGKAADQPVKHAGQVAALVSRKEKKIFVRQGMVPLFEMPVTIDDPDQPLGTHVFTAMTVTGDGAGMRWNLMTIPTDPSAAVGEQRDSRRKSKEPPPSRPTVHLKPPSTAAAALDRIQLPKDAVDRISELLVPGSSLVVSDEGLGRETGRYTEFIVLSR
jgi:hypothetical protein